MLTAVGAHLLILLPSAVTQKWFVKCNRNSLVLIVIILTTVKKLELRNGLKIKVCTPYFYFRCSI